MSKENHFLLLSTTSTSDGRLWAKYEHVCDGMMQKSTARDPQNLPTLSQAGIPTFCLYRGQALTFSKEVFGQGSIEMVPPYLILSEANLGLGLLHNAEQFLSMANWSILKTPHCSNSLRSQVFGRSIHRLIHLRSGHKSNLASVS